MSVFMIDSQDAIRKREFPDILYAVHTTSLFDILSTDHLSGLSKPTIVDTFMFVPCILNNKCSLYTNIGTNKYCKFILNYPDMFRCSYTVFWEFTVVLAKVVNC